MFVWEHSSITEKISYLKHLSAKSSNKGAKIVMVPCLKPFLFMIQQLKVMFKLGHRMQDAGAISGGVEERALTCMSF